MAKKLLKIPDKFLNGYIDLDYIDSVNKLFFFKFTGKWGRAIIDPDGGYDKKGWWFPIYHIGQSATEILDCNGDGIIELFGGVYKPKNMPILGRDYEVIKFGLKWGYYDYKNELIRSIKDANLQVGIGEIIKGSGKFSNTRLKAKLKLLEYVLRNYDTISQTFKCNSNCKIW